MNYWALFNKLFWWWLNMLIGLGKRGGHIQKITWAKFPVSAESGGPSGTKFREGRKWLRDLFFEWNLDLFTCSSQVNHCLRHWYTWKIIFWHRSVCGEFNCLWKITTIRTLKGNYLSKLLRTSIAICLTEAW